MSRPLLLDLFCGAGGAAMGYHQAGFDIVGIDIGPQPNYPFDFIQGDALKPPVRLDAFDAIHASPPCQAYTVAKSIHGRDDHPDLVDATRALLVASGLPYVIENVPGSPLRNWIQLCGRTFGLGVKRHRWFETTIALLVPPCPKSHPGDWVTVFGHSVLGRGHKRRHLGADRGREAMGIAWMTRDELSEAIPPAYTRYIGEQLIGQIGGN